MPQQWKDFQVTAGSLMAFVAGLLAMGATFVGVQSWVDERIDQRLAYVIERVGKLETGSELNEKRYQEVKKLLQKIEEGVNEDK